jgi:catecholate siderophore receptor
MRTSLSFAFAVGCALAAVAPKSLEAKSFLPVDTVAERHFDVPAQTLIRTLNDIGQQAGVAVEIRGRIPATVVAPQVSGSYTLPAVLRLVLNGTGFRPSFSGGKVVAIVRDQVEQDAPVYNLRPIEVVGARNRGYSTVRTTTATKTDIPLRDAPQSISVVTRDVIADQSMQSMMDVMRLIPGVTMGQGEGHRDAPTMRGNSSTADFFVDGVRDDAQYYRDLYNVERVEALKGANALMFGRGGGGGVINRVIKEPQWAPERVVTVRGGTYEHRRGTVDVTQPLSENVSVRFNGMREDSDGFRDEMRIEHTGINPTIAVAISDRTMLRGGYEFFSDDRTVDRGIPSFGGRPSAADRTTFFGNPDSSYATTRVHTATAVLEQKRSNLTLRNRIRFTDYDKFYQNSFPGALDPAGTQVTLSAYNNGTVRQNVFNQTDVITSLSTGSLNHTLVFGIELGRQHTENFRETGYYDNTSTSYTTSFDQPTVDVPITFRQSATDADNRSVVTLASVYAQDQLALSAHWQAIAGVRFDRFDIDFHNNRNNTDLDRRDALISPRAGLLFKPSETASLYGSYSVSYLPSSGDQFSSLTATTQTLKPEQFTNLEVGAKWDLRANLSITAAVYQLDRTNTTAPDPTDPTRVIQTGSQRARGFEAGIAGDITPSWHVVGGMSFQKAEITSTTSSAPEGAIVALVPERTFSLWNRYRVLPAVGLGFGVTYQDDMFAAIDNTVTLPGFTRADAALFLRANSAINAQLNVENLFDTDYFSTSHGNNNIMPGAGRILRLTLTTRL